jgi:small multidrug resistance pump
MTYLYLTIAIVGEVTATSVLKLTHQFSRPGPTAVVAVAGAVIYREVPDRPAILGMFLIIAGVVVINTFSRNVGH